MADTPTYRLSLVAERDAAHSAETVLSELYWPPASAVGLTEAPNGMWRVDAYFDAPPDAGLVAEAMSGLGIAAEDFTVQQLEDVDWVTRSQARLHPVCAGRFTVHGGHDRACLGARRWAIEIDAAQAFGTAHHGSTTGCLVALDDLAKRTRAARALDIGTGTGVLAIAAARLWNARVVAGDIDPVAVEVARTNIRLNGEANKVHAVVARGLGHPAIRAGAPYDLVLANILARPLIAMAHDTARALRPGGFVILSGVTEDQAGRVAAAYCVAGFTRHRRYAISGWVTLTMIRSARR